MSENKVLTPREKVEALKEALHTKKFQSYTLEQVSDAVEVAIGVLPRVKNYFTQLHKSIKLLVNKTALIVKLTEYALENPQVEMLKLAASIKAAAGSKTVSDEVLHELLDAKDFPIVSGTRATKKVEDLDFNVDDEEGVLPLPAKREESYSEDELEIIEDLSSIGEMID